MSNAGARHRSGPVASADAIRVRLTRTLQRCRIGDAAADLVRSRPVSCRAEPTGEGGSRTVADLVVDLRRDAVPRRVLRSAAVVGDDVRSACARGRRAVSGRDASASPRAASPRRRAGAVPLADPRLDAFDVVVVGGLDRLSAADAPRARSLHARARRRGGRSCPISASRPGRRAISVACPAMSAEPGLTNDCSSGRRRSTATPPARVAPGVGAAGRARAGPGRRRHRADVPGADGGPVIVSTPRGDGRLLLSGAMDAWRFRAADNGAFDRFWQSTIAGLALAVPPPIAIASIRRCYGPASGRRSRSACVRASAGGCQRLARRRSADPLAARSRGRRVSRHCSSPARRPADRSSRSALPAADAAARHASLVQADAAPMRVAQRPSLGLLSSSHRGIDVPPDRARRSGALSARRRRCASRAARSTPDAIHLVDAAVCALPVCRMVAAAAAGASITGIWIIG